jgi:hypothetical protein
MQIIFIQVCLRRADAKNLRHFRTTVESASFEKRSCKIGARTKITVRRTIQIEQKCSVVCAKIRRIPRFRIDQAYQPVAGRAGPGRKNIGKRQIVEMSAKQLSKTNQSQRHSMIND